MSAAATFDFELVDNSVSYVKKDLVDQNTASWNHIKNWLRRVEALRAAA